jgi:hypothetical protein
MREAFIYAWLVFVYLLACYLVYRCIASGDRIDEILDIVQRWDDEEHLVVDEAQDTDLNVAARRALAAWDSTVLPRSHDGMMQERMEVLRAALHPPEPGALR